MLIALFEGGPPRGWHARLGERLAAMGHVLVLRPRDPHIAPRRDLRLLLAIERRLYGASSGLFAERDWPRDAGAVDLELTVLFDGVAGEVALVDALLRGRVPVVTVLGRSAGGSGELASGVLASGSPANEEPLVFSRGIDQVLARVIVLATKAVSTSNEPSSRHGVAPSPVLGGAPSAVAFLAMGLAKKLSRRVRRRADHWSIAVRGTAGLVDLAGGGASFQADPFLFAREGRTHLFFEEYPYATGRGVVARAEVDADGRARGRHVVLDEPFHLSYPFVLSHRGHVYMLPETSGARRIQLYRADPFPDRWVADTVLVADIVAADATPILHEGRWWLFCAVAGDGGSSWDQLALFSAPDLLGPWTAHAGNPVLVDAGAARPAGAMWHEGGALMRVAQDCRAGYGAGLAICRVDRLDAGGFGQTVVERLGPPDASGAIGLHTRNRAGALEAIDLKWPRRRR